MECMTWLLLVGDIEWMHKKVTSNWQTSNNRMQEEH